MIYYLCPDQDTACGGVRIIYRHVDLLCEAGRGACVLHWAPGFRCSWFAGDTPTRDVTHTPLDAQRDILVVPEIYGPELDKIAPGVPKVVFNQNAYLTFAGYSADPADRRTPYREAIASGEVLGVLVESEDSARYLQYTFGADLPLRRIRLAVDPALFRYVSLEDKLRANGGRPLLSYMPRKAPHDAVQVMNILKHRGVLDEYGLDVVAIDGQSAEEVALVLRRSVFFACFSAQEGLPVPPREAMACGAVVVGYDGFGGHEFFHQSCTVRVPMSDTLGFAQAVERLLDWWRRDPRALAEMGRFAAGYISRKYTPECERDDLLGAWDALLLRARARGQASTGAPALPTSHSRLTTSGGDNAAATRSYPATAP